MYDTSAHHNIDIDINDYHDANYNQHNNIDKHFEQHAIHHVDTHNNFVHFEHNGGGFHNNDCDDIYFRDNIDINKHANNNIDANDVNSYYHNNIHHDQHAHDHRTDNNDNFNHNNNIAK